MGRNKIDLTGKVFGRLTVVSENSIKSLSGGIRWNCQCECGKTTIAMGSNLRNGDTKSCGCYMIDKNTESNITHGMSRSLEYNIWRGINRRCSNPGDKAYHYYGGKGITVCDQWLNSFEAFYEDMGPRPSPDHSIDRRENDKGYYKDNCRWATRVEQQNNRRNNVFYEYKGQQYTIPQLAELPEAKILGITSNVLNKRLHILNWSVENSVNTPIKQYN
jgi:hypothetical protein